MINWHSIPMARLLIPLTFGFVVGFYAQESWPVLFIIFIFAFVVWLLSRHTNRLKRKNTLNAIMWQLLIMAVSSFLMHSKRYEFAFNHYSENKAVQFWVIEVKEWVKHSKDQQILIADVKATWSGKKWITCSGKVRIKCPDSSVQLKADGKWYIADAKTINGHSNPSYKAWLDQNNLASIIQIKSIQPLPIQIYYLKQSNRLSSWMLKTLLPNFDSATKGMVEAIVLGIKDHVPETVISLMKTCGTLHVLAVSGMHAALIFSLLSYGLKWMKKNTVGSWFYASICLLVLWTYCFMTGASASVLRATIMCSLVILADVFKRKSQTINTLLNTVLLMLLLDPFTLFNVGFQLSFTAVLGILVVYPRIQTLYIKQKGVYKWLLDSLNMSFSAQCFSTQISWFYFLQYPTYSLIANLLIVPLYSIVLIAILMCLPFYHYPVIILWIGKGIALCIELGNTLMFWISEWPVALYHFKTSSIVELFVLYGISIYLFTGISQKNIKYFQLGLCLSIGFLIWKQILENHY